MNVIMKSLLRNVFGVVAIIAFAALAFTAPTAAQAQYSNHPQYNNRPEAGPGSAHYYQHDQRESRRNYDQQRSYNGRRWDEERCREEESQRRYRLWVSEEQLRYTEAMRLFYIERRQWEYANPGYVFQGAFPEHEYYPQDVYYPQNAGYLQSSSGNNVSAQFNTRNFSIGASFQSAPRGYYYRR